MAPAFCTIAVHFRVTKVTAMNELFQAFMPALVLIGFAMLCGVGFLMFGNRDKRF